MSLSVCVCVSEVIFLIWSIQKAFEARCFTCVTRMSLGCLRVSQGCPKDVLKVFKGFFKGVSRMFQENFKGVLRAS